MKIVVNNKVFIQGIDLLALIKMPLEVPASLYEEISQRYGTIAVHLNRELLDFSYGFTNADVVEWILDQDWILDYDYYKSVPGHTIHQKIDELESICEQLYSDWERDGDCGQNSFDEMAVKMFYSRYQIKELDMLLNYRKSRHRITFPAGYDDKKSGLLS